jgi:predicted HTH transcriptional regulator
MDIKQIVLDLCALSDEQEWFEFKENWFQPESLGEYVSALSNAAAFHYKKYAYFIWGVNDTKSGMNPKTLQYLMGHSDISVTMNVYTHIGFDDAEEELKRMEEFRKAQAEVEQKKDKPMSQKMFKVV